MWVVFVFLPNIQINEIRFLFFLFFKCADFSVLTWRALKWFQPMLCNETEHHISVWLATVGFELNCHVEQHTQKAGSWVIVISLSPVCQSHSSDDTPAFLFFCTTYLHFTPVFCVFVFWPNLYLFIRCDIYNNKNCDLVLDKTVWSLFPFKMVNIITKHPTHKKHRSPTLFCCFYIYFLHPNTSK